MKELIADKIKRLAAAPEVIKNRSQLKAMWYITQRENAEMKLEVRPFMGEDKVFIATCSVLRDEIVMFPICLQRVSDNNQKI